uniref:Uncharacterized protein n=1 Tax=Cucumis melo TaxID=3656 RepID=A0A9I9ELQ7_CUCME
MFNSGSVGLKEQDIVSWMDRNISIVRGVQLRDFSGMTQNECGFMLGRSKLVKMDKMRVISSGGFEFVIVRRFGASGSFKKSLELKLGCNFFNRERKTIFIGEIKDRPETEPGAKTSSFYDVLINYAFNSSHREIYAELYTVYKSGLPSESVCMDQDQGWTLNKMSKSGSVGLKEQDVVSGVKTMDRNISIVWGVQLRDFSGMTRPLGSPASSYGINLEQHVGIIRIVRIRFMLGRSKLVKMDKMSSFWSGFWFNDEQRGLHFGSRRSSLNDKNESDSGRRPRQTIKGQRTRRTVDDRHYFEP